MNRNEWWMAACALVLAVGVGQAQDKQTKATPNPVPPVLYIPSVPPSPELTLHLVGLEAVGCKTCTQAVQAAEAKSKSCTSCENCAAAKDGECCGECVKSKRAAVAVGCSDECKPVVKKVKKVKRIAVQDYIFVAPPPPAPPMPSQFAAGAVYAQPVSVAAPTSVLVTTRAEAEPMIVFRAASTSKATGCGGCDDVVQQTKHETHGSIAIGFGISRTGYVVPGVQVTTHGQMEIECGGACIAKCEQMTLKMPGDKEWTIAPLGKQVVISGPSLKASCDSLTRNTADGATCLLMQGHVRLQNTKPGMKADVESEQVLLVIRDGMMELHTGTSP